MRLHYEGVLCRTQIALLFIVKKNYDKRIMLKKWINQPYSCFAVSTMPHQPWTWHCSWKSWGCRDGAVVRALASHLCGLGSIPGPGVTCGLSLLLVLALAPRVFLRVLRFSSLHKNQHPKFQFGLEMRATGLSALLLVLPSLNKVHFIFYFYLALSTQSTYNSLICEQIFNQTFCGLSIE